VWGLPGSFKDKIALTEGTSTLYGWMAGYLATDGSVSSRGQISLSSADWDHLDWARTVATRLGLAVGDFHTYSRCGLGQSAPTDIFSVRMSAAPRDLLLREDHGARWQPTTTEPPAWTVRSVQPHVTTPLWTVETELSGCVVLDGYVVVPR
jgi:DNA primase